MPLRALPDLTDYFLSLGRGIPIHIFTEGRYLGIENQTPTLLQLKAHIGRIQSLEFYPWDESEMQAFHSLLEAKPYQFMGHHLIL